ncbi:MAG: DUF2017 domain-containing protein [Actinomycetia bacterium]|nr:DUF2017 domain-containing protein [Actinomycetes bacterium]
MARKKARQIFEPTPSGFVINLGHDERELVTRLIGELRELLLSNDPRSEPLLRRLFPPAYHLADDAEANAEYQRLMREELVASRLAAIEEADRLLNSDEALNEAAMLGLLQSLNAVRLVLGTLLDVGETHDPSGVSDDDPMIGEHHLYQFLSFLLESAVEALSGQQG